VPRDHRLLASGRRTAERPVGGTTQPPGPTGSGSRPNYHTTVQRAYLASTRALNRLLIVVGVAMIVSALLRGGGALALGVILGAMFVLLGAGRLWLARGGRR
jgi:hypothetical protein